jgi:phenylacetic acid degradation operon negative regulatory protein
MVCMPSIDQLTDDVHAGVAVGHDLADRSFGAHRPQTLVLSFLASRGLHTVRPLVPSRIFIKVLGELGINEGATRRTLARMVDKDLLVREVSGRNTAYRLTQEARGMLLAGRQRVNAPEPFAHSDETWTLLAFSMRERHRDLRHQLRTRLLWAGLGPLRDGLWIAPGRVDVEALLAGVPLEAAHADPPWAFTAQPLPPTHLDTLIRRVWDVEAIRAAHNTFLSRWFHAPKPSLEPMAALSLLIADWLRLLRSDPGLPKSHLGDDWPADQSTQAYQSGVRRMHSPADDEFNQAMTAAERSVPPSLEHRANGKGGRTSHS